MTAVPGSSLDESLLLGDRLTQGLLQIPSGRSVAQRAGRAELGIDTNGTHQSEIDVNLQAVNGAQLEAAQDDIPRVLAEVPGAVVVNVFGNDLDQLDLEAAQIAGFLATIPGGTEVQLSGL